MSETDQLSQHAEQPTGPRALRVTGWLLIAVGFVSSLGSVLRTWLYVISTDCWWISTAIVLAVVFQRSPLRTWSRLASASMLLIWIVSRFDVLQYVGEDSATRIGQEPLGSMLAILGALLVFTNNPHGRRRPVFGSVARLAASHRKAIALVCVSALIVPNPGHSHSVCLRAATLCERQGAYDAAVYFATLARDTFPAPTFCGTCYALTRQDLTWRIARIEAKREGVLGPQMFDDIAPGVRSADISAPRRVETAVRSVSERRPMDRGGNVETGSP